jgi:hypothetical protein
VLGSGRRVLTLGSSSSCMDGCLSSWGDFMRVNGFAFGMRVGVGRVIMGWGQWKGRYRHGGLG